MATSVDFKEEAVQDEFADLLMCTICRETFTQPKYLPCLHTFCEVCISSYIISTVKVTAFKGFSCPTCQRFVAMEKDKIKPEKWAKSLPGNQFFVSMIDRWAMEKAEKLCDACRNENICEKAISWCTICEEAYCATCEGSHRKFKMSRTHKISSIKDIYRNNVCSSVACNEHPDKAIEIYCKDHSKPCCTVCATIHHRKCEHVITIDKAVYGIKESEKARNLLMKLKKTSYKLEIILQNRKENTKDFGNKIDDVLSEIVHTRKEINNRLDELELQIKEEVKQTRKTTIWRLNEQTNELVALKNTLDYWRSMLEACLSQGSEIQYLVKIEKVCSLMQQFENDLSTVLQATRNISVKFESMDIFSNAKYFGRLYFNERRPSILGRIKVSLAINITGAYISGIFFNDDIIITEYDRHRIVHHDHMGREIEHLKSEICTYPTDITKVNDQTVAVSSNAKNIFIINVKPLTILTTLGISIPMFGIFLRDGYSVSACNSIISLSDVDSSAKIEEYHMIFDVDFKVNNSIFRHTHSIKFESSVGISPKSKSSFSSPFHNNIDCDGNIYMIDHSSRAIHQLTPNGQIVRIILLSDIDKDMIERPWVLRFKQNTNIFLLTFHGTRNQVYICEIN
ncbi:Hypothetical predicted protein [Mytilus galloprovincialis]|uniref:TRIM56 n=1 Tax=Mytilus galloprovincialis TaxID=29158 RepID=A0A8B6FQR7_MYTGA|nr:Hypothetical predicted protein [Mytilus galloprovincialis]